MTQIDIKSGTDPSRNSGRNIPPPVYRPIPAVLQEKTASPATPAGSGAPPVYRPFAATSQLRPAGAPPVYRPVTQAPPQKTSPAAPAVSGVPPVYRPSAPASQLKRAEAPPVYRPASGAQTGAGAQMKPGSSAPPAYRLHVTAMQAKPIAAEHKPTPNRPKVPASPIVPAPFRSRTPAVLQRAEQPQYQKTREQVEKSQYTREEEAQLRKERAERIKNAQLLTNIARPQVLTLPSSQIKMQKEIEERLEKIAAVRVELVGLGGVLLPEDLSESADENISASRFIDPPEPRAKMPWFFQEVKVDEYLVRAIVANTIRTMHQAGQIAYLRSSGLTKGGSAVIVEVHYYRDRNPNQTGMHKDTLGETLFVNLNYTNEEEISGPEYIFNPRPVESHEDLLYKQLPERALSDLERVRAALPKPTRVEWAGNIPRYGVVAFADELIHHATPTTAHRGADALDIKKYLVAKHPTAYANAENNKFTSNQKTGNTRITKELWEMANDRTNKKFRRPELRAAGMPDQSIDILMDQYIKNDSKDSSKRVGWASVSIPGSERAEILESYPQGRPLTRTISTTHLYDQDLSKRPKPLIDARKQPKRRFFRTWVRAVRRQGRAF